MDLDLIKSKLGALQPEKKEKYEKVDYTTLYWKPREEGKFVIRFVPSKFNTQYPFQEVFLHYGFAKFPIYALTNWGESDPIVEFAKKLRNTNESENWSLAKKVDPKMRIFAQVIVRGEEEKGVRLYEFGKQQYQQLLSLADDEDYGDFTDINEGFDFTIDAAIGDIGGRQGLKSVIRPKRKSTPLSKDADLVKKWLETQNNILDLQERFKKKFEDLKVILQNWLEPGDEEGSVTSESPSNFDNDVKEAPKSNYSLSTKKDVTSKADKFGKLFDDEEDEDGDDLPF